MITIAALHLYPIKGCAGLSLDAARVEATGLSHLGAGDREWMIVDAASGRFESQRTLPTMALIRPSLEHGALRLDAPGMPGLRLALSPAADGADAQTLTVSVWRHTGPAHDAGDAAAQWLSAYFGRALRLVRFDRRQPRHAAPEWTAGREVPTLFSDGFPLLAIGTASLADLNARLRAAGRAAVPMDRFRPNLVLDGLGAGDEDHLSSFGDTSLELTPVKPCARCTVPAIDQATGIAGPDPVDILAGYRDDPRVGGITFGQNVIVTRGAGSVLRVGQTLEPQWNF
jgi:uncharacterized protein